MLIRTSGKWTWDKEMQAFDEYLGAAWSTDFCLLVINVTPDRCCTDVHWQNEAFLLRAFPLTPHGGQCYPVSPKPAPALPSLAGTGHVVSSLFGDLIKPPYLLRRVGAEAVSLLTFVRLILQSPVLRVSTGLHWSPHIIHSVWENITGAALMWAKEKQNKRPVSPQMTTWAEISWTFPI